MTRPPFARPSDEDLLRDPREGDLAEPILELLADEEFGPTAQSVWLRLAGGPLALEYADRVSTRPLVVLATPAGLTGLDVHLAEPTADGGLIDISAGELKGPGSPGQAGRISALTDPQLPEAHDLQRQISAAVAAGTLQLDVHSEGACACTFTTTDGGRLRYKEYPARTCPDGIAHVAPQLVQLGYLGPASSAVVVPGPRSVRAGARITAIHPEVRGLFVAVRTPSDGLVGKYRSTPQLVWPTRWAIARHEQLLHGWAEAAAGIALGPAAVAALEVYAARVWMAASWTAVHRWPEPSLDLVPPTLPATFPCRGRCCAP